MTGVDRVTSHAFFAGLLWLDGSPLLEHIEPYRLRLFELFLDTFDETGRLLYNLLLAGRAKKNAKTLDLMLGALFTLLEDSPGGNQGYLVANDADQADDDLDLAKLIVRANPRLEALLRIRVNVIERRDGEGFIEVLPAKDALGAHGKTFRFLGVDEVHGYRSWDLLEALAPDPTRRDTQTWITSYASVHHKPGAPLFDLLQQARAGQDPRLLFSWYAADVCTDPAFADLSPEARANPSMASWGNDEYLAQQKRRLPAHKYRRLHLNLPGMPEGSAFQAEPVMDAVERGVSVRLPDPTLTYKSFVDMSGGSSEDAVQGIGHQDAEGRCVLDLVMDQGAPAPFDPNAAVTRFVSVLRDYRVTSIVGDRYAGETFRRQFEQQGIRYDVATRTKTQLYEALEPALNSHTVVLLDLPELEQQLLGLVWRGGRIDHQSGEMDDWANAAAGLVFELGPHTTGGRGGGMVKLLGW